MFERNAAKPVVPLQAQRQSREHGRQLAGLHRREDSFNRIHFNSHLRHNARLLETRVQQTARTKDVRQKHQGFVSQGCQSQVATGGEVMPGRGDQDKILLKQRLALDPVGSRWNEPDTQFQQSALHACFDLRPGQLIKFEETCGCRVENRPTMSGTR